MGKYMIYITGDTHGDFSRYIGFTAQMKPTENDVVIVLGDAALNYYGTERDQARKAFVNSFPFTTFCIHGNHEARPETIPSYLKKEYCGGTVLYEEAYPNILFAKDGEIYTFGSKRYLVIGGAYSVDKFFRLQYGDNWWPDEQPSAETKALVERKIAAEHIDIILSHTCPFKYIPTEAFIPGIDQSTVDQSTEHWLDEIESKTDYKKWYCGHWHIEKRVDKMEFLYHGFAAQE